MSDVNLVGIDLSTGQLRPITENDVASNSDGNPLLGVTGLRGATGILGPTGLQGQTGFLGFPGITGLQGRTGIRGVTGIAAGSQGLTGLQGSTGVQGYGNYSLLTGATTISIEAYIVGLDSTGGAFAVTLPLASAAGAARRFYFQDEAGVAQTNNITITPQGENLINGQESFVISFNYQGVDLYSNGSNYFARNTIGATGLQGATGI